MKVARVGALFYALIISILLLDLALDFRSSNPSRLLFQGLLSLAAL